MNGAAASAKGVRFERKIRRLFEEGGFTVRGLEAEGDHVAFSRDGLVLSSECKDQRRLKIPEWWAQASADSVPGSVTTLSFNLYRVGPLTVCRTPDFVQLVAR